VEVCLAAMARLWDDRTLGYLSMTGKPVLSLLVPRLFPFHRSVVGHVDEDVNIPRPQLN
jgi:hypothetical protein